MTLITEAKLKACMPTIKDSAEWADLMNKFLPLYGVNTPARIAMFIAQCGHEASDFTVFSENLNYSADNLRKVWPNRFNVATAAIYARKPEKIANRVYADRMGNGNEASGDGWTFKGRGLIQITGKANYAAFAGSSALSLVRAVSYLETKEGALKSALWFWGEHSLNALSDHQNVLAVTKIINGGTFGLSDRQTRFSKALKVFSA